MGATLQPGVRRLPTTDELALMGKLATDLKAGLDLSSDPTAPADPTDPDNLPAAPLSNGSGRSSVRAARARISRFGTTIVSTGGDDYPKYEVAANPTLTEAELETGAG